MFAAPPKRLRLLLVAGAAMLALMPVGLGTAASVVCAADRASDLHTLLLRPFSSEADAWALVRASGGRIVGPSEVPGLLVVRSADPAFGATARSLGALMVLDAGGPCGMSDQPA